jgi:VCBS repeat-containing protein
MKTTTPGSRHRFVRFVLGFLALAFLASHGDARAVVQAHASRCDDTVCEDAKTGSSPAEWNSVHLRQTRANFESSSSSTQLPVTPPASGPPVLIVTSASNPFTTYYSEILRTEGFNLFQTADISTVVADTLAGYDVVILGEMPLTAGQVTMFGDWVTAGGNLVAMRPDKQLYGLLGLIDLGTSLSNGYLLTRSDSGVPTAGIVNETIQFHGDADLTALDSAALVATLYAGADNESATESPAITLRGVGVAGGQAAAFLYDLARSVVLTHQGNPAWSGQNRDLLDPIRSNDLFYGPADADPQPDWVDLSKVHIPQADEQQRLLANAILYMTQDRKPLPRFWYFPRNEKAVVVMTGDAHGLDTSTARLNELNAASAPNCSLNDWDCLRGTAYIYPNTLSLFDGGPGGVASYIAQGHEIALHTNTDCQNYTAASLDQTLTTQLAELAQKYPSIPAPRTNRTHCIVWSDYTSQAEVELRHGIRFDTTYYYWPGMWVQNRPGFMGGSGMPMRFAKSTGETIDVYQDVTEFIDEDNSSHTFPFFANALLDRAIGAEGYYGVFTANMHGDGGNNSDVKQAHIVASAMARGVPVVSAAQMLDWLDGRNNSSFGSLTWNGTTTTLSFTVTNGAGANGLRGMLPAFGSGTPTAITRDGSSIGFTLETIKGVTYALFDATTGLYQATYGPDTTAAAISNVSAKPLTSSTAVITWSTTEAATTRVDYGTRDTSLNLFANDNTQVSSHAMTLTGLLPETKYYYRVTSVDFFGNPATFPAATEAPLTFTTLPLLQSFTDTTAADFGAGTPDTATLVAQTADGEVILKPTDGSEFFGSTLASNWTSGVWGADGRVTISAGRLQLNNGWARTTAEYGPGRSLEFVATFGPDAFQHSGFGRNFNGDEPWAIFSTSATTGQLFARTKPATGGETSVAITGNWIGTPHRFRIDWNAQDVVYFIDGTQVARHLVQIASPMQMLAASDFDSDSAFGTNPFSLTLDWERMSPYPSSGQYFSRLIDAGAAKNWYNVAWTQGTPGGTSVAIDVRAGDSPTPDGSWTGFVRVSEPGAPITGLSAHRYLQYRATLTTTNPHVSPELRSVTVNHAVGAPNTAPTAQDDDATTDEDTLYTFPAIGAGSLTANDSDVETPNALTVIGVGSPTNGTVTLNLDGSVTFAPLPNVNGVGAFTYTVSDGALNDDGIVTITINPVNDAPVGAADPSAAPGSFYQATEDVALLVPIATGVLANDTDVETAHAALTAQAHTLPAHGTLTLSPDGSFLYQPAPNYSGPDGFFYRVSDGTALSAPTGVSILVQGVNDAPLANDDSFTLSRSGVPITVTALVRDGSTVTATTGIAHGFATGHPVRIDGAIEADYNGVFTVTATGAKTFSYTVAGTPASPASGTIHATAEDTTRTFAAPGVIANDSDLEGQTLTASLVAGAENSTQNGTLSFNSNGSFTYTPGIDFVGVDTFKYSVADGNGGSDTATVTIAVHGEIATVTVGDGGGTVTTGVSATIVDPLETTVSTPIAGEVTIEQTAVSADSTAAGYTFLGQQVNITISTINEAQPLPIRPFRSETSLHRAVR